MSLFSLLSVGASGMAAQRTRAELLVENLANAETTRTPDGGRAWKIPSASRAVASSAGSRKRSEARASTCIAVP